MVLLGSDYSSSQIDYSTANVGEAEFDLEGDFVFDIVKSFKEVLRNSMMAFSRRRNPLSRRASNTRRSFYSSTDN